MYCWKTSGTRASSPRFTPFILVTEVTISEIMSRASLGCFSGSCVHKWPRTEATCLPQTSSRERRISSALFLLSLVFFRFDDAGDFFVGKVGCWILLSKNTLKIPDLFLDLLKIFLKGSPYTFVTLPPYWIQYEASRARVATQNGDCNSWTLVLEQILAKFTWTKLTICRWLGKGRSESTEESVDLGLR